MTNDLFAYARKTDPGTSHAAARSMDGKPLSRVQLIVADAIGGARDRGAICDEIVDATGLNWNTVSPRLAPLYRRGIIAPRLACENARPITRKGKSGRQQIVWFLCQR